VNVTLRAGLLALAAALPLLASAAEPAPAVEPAPALPVDAVPPPVVAAPVAAPTTVGMPEGEVEALKPKSAAKVQFKPGGHLRIATEDGRYSLAIGARFQLWYALTGVPGDDGRDDLTHSFQLRRARVFLSGAIIDGKVKYNLELGFAPRDMGLNGTTITRSPLFEGWVASEHLRDLSFRAGQMKVPFNHEYIISTGALQTVDLSAPTQEFNLDFDLGAMLYSTNAGGLDKIRWFAGVYSGEGHSSWQATPLGVLAAGRVEIFPMGTWDDYMAQGDLNRDRKAHLGLGAAFAYQHGGHRDRGTLGPVFADGGTAEIQHATADLVFDVAGFSLEGAFFWRHGVRTPGSLLDGTGQPIPVAPVRNGIGIQAQAGYLIPRTGLELAGQYTQIRPLGQDSGITDVTIQLTGVVGYYFLRTAYKLQADYARIFTDAAGLQAGTDQFRLQLQLQL
jgi:hypothetical protein